MHSQSRRRESIPEHEGVPMRDVSRVLSYDVAVKVHQHLRGKSISLVWDDATTQIPTPVVATVGDKMIGYGSSAVVIDASISLKPGLTLDKFVLRVLPLTPETYRMDENVKRAYHDLARIGRIVAVNSFKHVVGSIGYIRLTRDFDLAELQFKLEPVEKILEFVKDVYRKHNKEWMLACMPEADNREFFLGSLLLSILSGLEEINSPQIRQIFLERLGVKDEELVRVVHQDVKLGNLFLDSHSRSFRLGDLNSLVPCLRAVPTHKKVSPFTTPSFAPPELLGPNPVWTARCGHFMAAATVRQVVTGLSMGTEEVTVKQIAREFQLNEDCPIVNVVAGCLKLDPEEAMSAVACLELLKGKYNAMRAPIQLGELLVGVINLPSMYVASPPTHYGRMDLDGFLGPVSLPSYVDPPSQRPDPRGSRASELPQKVYGSVAFPPADSDNDHMEVDEDGSASRQNTCNEFDHGEANGALISALVRCPIDKNLIMQLVDPFLQTKPQDRLALLQKHFPMGGLNPIDRIMHQGSVLFHAARKYFTLDDGVTLDNKTLGDCNRVLLLNCMSQGASGGRKIQLASEELDYFFEDDAQKSSAQCGLVLWRAMGKNLQCSFTHDAAELKLQFSRGHYYCIYKIVVSMTRMIPR